MNKKHAECIIFPDLHGRSFWRDAFNKDCEWDSQTYIFLGDYFDPYRDEGITPGAAIRNWNELNLSLKNHAGKEIIFLIGNHDAHYINGLFNLYARGSRYSKHYCSNIRQLLNRVNLRIAYELSVSQKKILFTHAGVTYPWYLEHQNLIGSLTADNLNALAKSEEGWMALSDTSFYRGGGQPYGSPLWADSEEFTNENIKDIPYDWQIAGHNQQKDDKAKTFGNIIDLDCHHAFVLTPEIKLIKL